MDLASDLPLALVMTAGPQVISAVFFATSEKWRGTSATFVAGGAIGVTGVYTVAYFLFEETKQSIGAHHGSTAHAIDIAILLLLFVAAAYTFRRRKMERPPQWKEKLQTASLRFSFILGLLVLSVFPADMATSASVGAHLANEHAPWPDGLPFILLTVLLLALPGLMVLLLGERAKRFLPVARDWMNANSWIISEIVLAFFVVIVSEKL